MQQQRVRSVRFCCSTLFGEQFQHDDPVEAHTKINIINQIFIFFNLNNQNKNRIEMENHKSKSSVTKMKERNPRVGVWCRVFSVFLFPDFVRQGTIYFRKCAIFPSLVDFHEHQH